MSDTGSDIEEKIESAKSEVKKLKKKLDGLKEEGGDDDISTHNDAVRDLEASSIELHKVLSGHLGKVYDVSWAGNSQSLVSASQDGRLLIWNAVTGNKVNIVSLKSNWVMAVGYSEDGMMVASGGLDNICSIFDMSSEEGPVGVLRELNAHTGYVSAIKFMSGLRVLTSSGDMSCILWDINTGQKQTEFTDHNGDVEDVDVLKSNENVFVSGSVDTTAKLWDVRTGNCESTFSGHQSDVNAVRFFPDGNAFVTGSDDASCRLFDLRANREVQKFSNEDFLCGISSVDFSLSGRVMFAGYDDFKVRGWDVLKGKEFVELSQHRNRASCLEVSPDGTALATGSWDKEVMVWI